MATFDISPAPIRPLGLRRAALVARRALDGIWAWNDARVSRAVLGRLSLHELADIGLHRGDIDTLTGRR